MHTYGFPHSLDLISYLNLVLSYLATALNYRIELGPVLSVQLVVFLPSAVVGLHFFWISTSFSHLWPSLVSMLGVLGINWEISTMFSGPLDLTLHLPFWKLPPPLVACYHSFPSLSSLIFSAYTQLWHLWPLCWFLVLLVWLPFWEVFTVPHRFLLESGRIQSIPVIPVEWIFGSSACQNWNYHSSGIETGISILPEWPQEWPDWNGNWNWLERNLVKFVINFNCVSNF
jgi:hypothetical protein